jgi:hypothetical protein
MDTATMTTGSRRYTVKEVKTNILSRRYNINDQCIGTRLSIYINGKEVTFDLPYEIQPLTKGGTR